MARLTFSILLLLLLLGFFSSLSKAQNGTANSSAESGSGEAGTGESHEVEDPCRPERERAFDSQVRIARFKFDEVRVLIIVTGFIMIAVLAKMDLCVVRWEEWAAAVFSIFLVFRFWHHKYLKLISSNIPESCMLIILGAHIGGIIIGSFYINRCNRGMEPPFRFTSNLFFLYLLPPIVLEQGYFLNIRAFFENLVTILAYAVIGWISKSAIRVEDSATQGTLWNAFALGFTLYGLFQAKVMLVGLNVNFTISSALLFGTICAAVDPVAVLAVFEEIHVNKLLHILVFGESLLNDAVTIVLFQVLGAFANRPFDAIVNGVSSNIGVSDVFLGIGQFIVVVTASVVIGILVGMVAAFITRFSEHVHVLEPIIILVMGYLSYIIADMFAFSGIVSLILCAMVMKHFAEANMSWKSQTTIKYSLKVLSSVSEAIIFFFLGLSLYDTMVQNWDTGLVLWTLLFALIFRPIGVVVLTAFMNIFRVRTIGLKSVFVMSYSGLRGAVAFSLAISRIFDEPELMTSENKEIQEEFLLRKSMLTAVTFLVLFTVFVQGTTIKPLVKRIKVQTATEHKPTMNETIHSTTIDHVMSGMEDILGHFGHNRLRERLQELDSKFLRKIFERYPEARDEQILHTFKKLQYKESNEAAEKDLVFEYHKEDSESYISLLECPEEHENIDHSDHSPEECIAPLNDVLAASFSHPHEDHFGHMLARKEREHNAADHRFEPVNVRKTRPKRKHAHQRHQARKKRDRASHPSTHPQQFEEQLAPVKEGEELQTITHEAQGYGEHHNIQAPILLESKETDV